MSSIDKLWDLIEKGKVGTNVGLSIGLPKIDHIIGGIQMGRYYTLAASSSVGKTSFMVYMLYRLFKDYSNEDIKCIYWSLEIGADVLLSKLLSLYCAEEFGIYLTTNDIFSFESPISDINYEYLKQGRKWLDSLEGKLIIIDKGLSSRILYKETLKIMESFGRITEVDGKKEYIPNNPNQKVFGVIDHLLLVTPEEGRSLKEEMDRCSSYIVTLKRKLNMSWFVLMQQNRNASTVERRKMDLNEPGLNDLQQTSAVGQDSDVVMMLYSPFREKIPTYRDYKIIGPKSFTDRFRSCLIVKNRYGEANKVQGLSFYGEVGYFKELPKGSEIPDATPYLDINTNIRKISTGQ